MEISSPPLTLLTRAKYFEHGGTTGAIVLVALALGRCKMSELMIRSRISEDLIRLHLKTLRISQLITSERKGLPKKDQERTTYALTTQGEKVVGALLSLKAPESSQRQ